MRLNVPEYSREQFTIHAGKLVAFASDFARPLAARVYDDAADAGFRVRWSGKTATYRLVREETQDGTLIAWHFETDEAVPAKEAVIFNWPMD